MLSKNNNNNNNNNNLLIYIFFVCISITLAVPLNRQVTTNSPTNDGSDIINDVENELTIDFERDVNIPQYMTDLYRAVEKNSDGDLMFQGNTVRSYFDQETAENEEKHSRYFFDVSDIKNEELHKAELHIYKYPSRKTNNLQNIIQVSIIDINTDLIISSRILTSKSYGWQIFPVTSNVNQWLANKQINKGVRIRVRSLHGKNDVKFATKNAIRREPILVVYTQGETDIALESLAEATMSSNILEKLRNETQSSRRKKRHINNNILSAHPCHVVPLKVPLEKIGWNKNFLSPPSFQINQCEGSCLGDKQTNHAIVQRLYATVTDGRHASYPCCSPTKFKSLPALMKDSSGRGEVYKIVKLDKLTVTECACL